MTSAKKATVEPPLAANGPRSASRFTMQTARKIGLAALLGVATVIGSMSARADVKHEGSWPEAGKDKAISLDLTQAPRADAVRKLADAAGWSVVTEGVGAGTVDVHVKQQPADRVLDLLLADGNYAASREGELVRIRPATAAPGASAPPVPSAVPVPVPVPVPSNPPATATNSPKAADDTDNDNDDDDRSSKSDDESKRDRAKHDNRTVFGSNVRVGPDETIGKIAAFGGEVEVAGHVIGGIDAFGGNVHILPGGHVEGPVSLLGGDLTLDDNATLEGSAQMLGGDVHRAAGAHMTGAIEHTKKHGHITIEDDRNGHEPEPSFIARAGNRLSNVAILFVFGTILLALAGTRMESMRVEVAARPVRAFALGVVSFIAACLAVLVLCVTIIGIPLALAGVCIAVFAGYAGACSALTTLGAALAGHRTQSVYVHLAIGCVLFYLVALIPHLGTLATLLVGAMGFGAAVATRGAQIFAKKRTPPLDDPYRQPY